jgi:hypothetical protein
VHNSVVERWCCPWNAVRLVHLQARRYETPPLRRPSLRCREYCQRLVNVLQPGFNNIWDRIFASVAGLRFVFIAALTFVVTLCWLTLWNYFSRSPKVRGSYVLVFLCLGRRAHKMLNERSFGFHPLRRRKYIAEYEDGS